MNKHTPSRLLALLKNRYVYISLSFVIWISFIDDFNLIQQYFRSQELKVLQEKEERFKEKIIFFKENIKLLDENPEVLESYAREHYKMKRENEDVYIFENTSEQ